MSDSKEQLKDEKISLGLACFLGKTTIVELFLSLNMFNSDESLLHGKVKSEKL